MIGMDYSEQARDARRVLEREREEMMERAGQLDAHLRVLDTTEAVLKEYTRLTEENVGLQQQLNDERLLRAELEMKLMEMSKLSTGMAKKASEENVLKALDFCESRVRLYDEKIRRYVAEGVPAEDEPTTLALRLIDEVGCGRPASLFLALHTVSEHLKEMA